VEYAVAQSRFAQSAHLLPLGYYSRSILPSPLAIHLLLRYYSAEEESKRSNFHLLLLSFAHIIRMELIREYSKRQSNAVRAFLTPDLGSLSPLDLPQMFLQHEYLQQHTHWTLSSSSLRGSFHGCSDVVIALFMVAAHAHAFGNHDRSSLVWISLVCHLVNKHFVHTLCVIVNVYPRSCARLRIHR